MDAALVPTFTFQSARRLYAQSLELNANMVSEEGLTRLNRILESSGKVSHATVSYRCAGLGTFFIRLDVGYIGPAAVELGVAGTGEGFG